jgi:signal transduction histidine kinase
MTATALPNLGERTSTGIGAPLPALWDRASIKVAAGVGLSALALSVLLPSGTTTLTWFIPVADSVMILLFGVVAALGSLDAILRRHGRSVPLAAAAAASAVLWIPHMLTFPGVIGSKSWGGPQTAGYLFELAHIGTPLALALALILRPGPLRRPVRATVTSMVVAVATATALIGLCVGLAAHLPALVEAEGFTPFSKALTYISLVPILVAGLIFLAGHRGDDRVAGSVAAALVLLTFESFAEAAVPGRFATGWYIAHGLGTAPALALLIGQLALYARTVLDQTNDEAKLRRSTEELARSNANLEAFASVAAHDLISPLTVMGGFAQMLESELRGDELAEAREWANRIVTGTTRMKTLVDDLLSFARLGSDLEPQPIDTEELMTELVATVRATSENTGEISIGSLPIVHGDRTQLSQLFQNLLTNALKFTPAGETARVEVSAARSGDSWIFAVEDDGIGIAPESRELVFKMFKRLHPGELYGGTGIGLAICRRVAENHGGRIWAEGNSKSGTTIRVALPYEW